MPSDLIVDSTKVKKISFHPNADKLELSTVKGWQVVVQKDSLKAGDIVYYFPPDCLIPRYISKLMGVEQYLSFSKRYVKEDSEMSLGRVKVIKLRKEISHGFIIKYKQVENIAKELNIEIDNDIIKAFNIEKWESPIRVGRYGFNIGKPKTKHPFFFKYTNIQNIRHFPDTFTKEDIIVITEKIHGTNFRIAKVPHAKYKWYKPWTWGKEWVIGSHNVRKTVGKGGVYQLPLTSEMKSMVNYIAEYIRAKAIIVYGEVYGGDIQKLKYGKDKPDFIVFDIRIDGNFIGWNEIISYCTKFNIPTVPVLYKGGFSSWEHLEQLSKGKTTLMEDGHIREGCVIKTIFSETNDTKRKIRKFISDDYLLRKNGTEFH